MSDTQEKFWIVWSPTGVRPPLHRHPTQHAAITEAERLARSAPGSEFFVLGAEQLRFVDGMHRVEFLDSETPIPF